MKKTETVTNIQYIVGGIGSMFRTKLVRDIGLYDTNTITEDIDLSMKILARYSGKYHIGYHPEVITQTEAVQDIKGLIRQRNRWKYGRYQAFLKHRELFWSKNKNHNKFLSWVYLPYALISEVLYFFEPMVFLFIIYLLVSFGDISIVASSFLVFTFYTTMHVSAATNGYSLNERLRFIAYAPLAYIGMYVLSFVEYGATIHGFMNISKIFRDYKSGNAAGEWEHVKRKGNAAIS